MAVTETAHSSGFILSEAQGKRSRDNVTIVSGQNLLAGTVLGRTGSAGAGAATANTGNTGNGAMGAITVTGPAKAGIYRLTVITAAANAGEFQVEDPDGVDIGVGNVASAFSKGGLAFTLADGSTDFVVGDGFAIVVTETEKMKKYDPANTDGSEVAAAILLADCDASAADKAAAVIARSAEVNTNELVWFSGATTAQKAAAALKLAEKGIIVRS